jgi:hypothetical protein
MTEFQNFILLKESQVIGYVYAAMNWILIGAANILYFKTASVIPIITAHHHL